MTTLAESNHYHLWADALHARALAHETPNQWDRGTYVRFALMSAWATLEIACQDALEDDSIASSFKRNLNAAITRKHLPPLEWDKGVWQRVAAVQRQRKSSVQRCKAESSLFPEASVADGAIKAVRDGINAIYAHAGKPAPYWAKDEFDQGWAGEAKAHAQVQYSIPPGLDEHAPDTLRLTYLYKDAEHTWALLRPGDDYSAEVENLLATIDRPISAARVYRGSELVMETSPRFNIDLMREIRQQP
jgi:hypothetical protein